MFYFTIYFIESACLMTAIACLWQADFSYLRHFILFLGLTVAVELAGLISWFGFNVSSYFIFNGFLLVEMGFLSYFLNKMCEPFFNSRPFVVAGLIVFLLCYVRDLFLPDVTNYYSLSNLASCIYIVSLCCLFYYHFLKHEVYIGILGYAPFWIVTGCFFFYMGSIVSILFFQYLEKLNHVNIRPIRYVIFIFLNLIEYGCWGYAFLCRYRQTI